MSSISREIKRNTGLRGYRPKQAQDKAKIKTSKLGAFATGFIAHLLAKKGSPEQSALSAKGWLEVPSHEWIYPFIYADKKRGGLLHTHLHAQKNLPQTHWNKR